MAASPRPRLRIGVPIGAAVRLPLGLPIGFAVELSSFSDEAGFPSVSGDWDCASCRDCGPGLGLEDASWPPDAHMNNKLIQHRVDGEEDMIAIHKSLGLKLAW